LELALACWPVAHGGGQAVGAGMKLDRIGPDLGRGFDLLRIGVDEERDLDAGAAEFGNEGCERVDLACNVEPTFGGDLLSALRYEAGSMRFHLTRNRKHSPRRRHFEIERSELRCRETGDVLVPDVAAILAEMRGDVVGSSLDRKLRRTQRIGMTASARIAE